MDQRSKLFISLPDGTSSIGGLEGIISDFDKSTLFVEASSGSSFSVNWEGLEVVCYFRLVTKKEPRKEMFFNFKASLGKLQKDKAGNSIFSMNMPAEIKIGQRRSSLRVSVDPKLVHGFSVWQEDHFIRPATNDKKKGLHKPLVSTEDIHKGNIRIVDLSAGGFKLQLKLNGTKNAGLSLNKGQTMIVWIVLLEPDNNQREQIWVKGKIKYSFEDPVTKDVDLGIEFVNQGLITPDKKMKWVRVRDHNIDKIGNWTYQRYLEEYRQGLV